jgi:hypothetical protein
VTEENCLAQLLVVAVARMANDPDYTAYRRGRKKILLKVCDLLEVIDGDLKRKGWTPELATFQRYFSRYKV